MNSESHCDPVKCQYNELRLWFDTQQAMALVTGTSLITGHNIFLFYPLLAQSIYLFPVYTTISQLCRSPQVNVFVQNVFLAVSIAHITHNVH